MYGDAEGFLGSSLAFAVVFVFLLSPPECFIGSACAGAPSRERGYFAAFAHDQQRLRCR